MPANMFLLGPMAKLTGAPLPRYLMRRETPSP